MIRREQYTVTRIQRLPQTVHVAALVLDDAVRLAQPAIDQTEPLD
jgi:hypothetical protein